MAFDQGGKEPVCSFRGLWVGGTVSTLMWNEGIGSEALWKAAVLSVLSIRFWYVSLVAWLSVPGDGLAKAE